jgi:hypothetical protein
MAEWDRRTPWRQGHVLAAETVATLGCLVSDQSPVDPLVVVVSHDCDLAQDPTIEPVAEVIIGCRADKANGSLTHGKNPRRLHVPGTDGGAAICIELKATARRSIAKRDLASHLPSGTVRIDPAARNTLQYWLAARYRRAAFPDGFNDYLDRQSGMAQRIAKILKPLGDHIVAVFFDVDEGLEREHANADDPFTLSIDLLYSTESEPTAAETAATSAAKAIDAAFRDRCFDKANSRWRGIELVACTPISDETLTYAMSLKLQRWNADYISLRAEPAQPMIEE